MIDVNEVLDRWNAASEAERDLYAKNRDTKTKSLFGDDDEKEGGHWLTIGSEKGSGGESHGGHHVFVGDDGKMKTGAFAGQTMQQAFGSKKVQDKPPHVHPPHHIQQKIDEVKARGYQHPDSHATVTGAEEYLKAGGYPRYRGEDEDHMRGLDQVSRTESAVDRTNAITGRKPNYLQKPKQQALFETHAGDRDQKPLFPDAATPDALKPKPFQPSLLGSQPAAAPAVTNPVVNTPQSTNPVVASQKAVDAPQTAAPKEFPHNDYLQADLNRARGRIDQDARVPRVLSELGHVNEDVDRHVLRHVRDKHPEIFNRMDSQRDAKIRFSRTYRLLDQVKAESAAGGQPGGDGELGKAIDEAGGPNALTANSVEDIRRKLWKNGGGGPSIADIRALAEKKRQAVDVSAESQSHASPPQSGGIVMPSTTTSNDQAKAGDQMGLFGEATKAKPVSKPFVPTLLGKGEESKAKQQSMFETMGDPNQRSLFTDGSEPEGMAFKPKSQGLLGDQDPKKDEPASSGQPPVAESSDSSNALIKRGEKPIVDAESIAKMAPGAIKRAEFESKANEEGLKKGEDNRKWSETFIKIAADDVSKLRRSDVDRVLSSAPSERRGYLESWIIKHRPDLAEEVNTVSQDLDAERAAQLDKNEPAQAAFDAQAIAKRSRSENKNVWAMAKEMGHGGLAQLSSEQRSALGKAMIDQAEEANKPKPPSPGRAAAMAKFKEREAQASDEPQAVEVPLGEEPSYDDVAVHTDGTVGIVHGSGGMGSDRVKLHHDPERPDNFKWVSRGELRKAKPEEHPEGYEAHRNEFGQTNWRKKESKGSDAKSLTEHMRKLHPEGKYADTFGPSLDRHLKGGSWKTAAQVAESGAYSKIASSGGTARDMKSLVDSGALQMAWDKTGMPHYAIAGVEKPGHLLNEEEADKAFSEPQEDGKPKPFEPTLLGSDQKSDKKGQIDGQLSIQPSDGGQTGSTRVDTPEGGNLAGPSQAAKPKLGDLKAKAKSYADEVSKLPNDHPDKAKLEGHAEDHKKLQDSIAKLKEAQAKAKDKPKLPAAPAPEWDSEAMRRKPAKEQMKAFQRDTVQKGDLIDIGGNGPVEVARVNKNTVTTTSGATWEHGNYKFHGKDAEELKSKFSDWIENGPRPKVNMAQAMVSMAIGRGEDPLPAILKPEGLEAIRKAKSAHVAGIASQLKDHFGGDVAKARQAILDHRKSNGVEETERDKSQISIAAKSDTPTLDEIEHAMDHIEQHGNHWRTIDPDTGKVTWGYHENKNQAVIHHINHVRDKATKGNGEGGYSNRNYTRVRGNYKSWLKAHGTSEAALSGLDPKHIRAEKKKAAEQALASAKMSLADYAKHMNKVDAGQVTPDEHRASWEDFKASKDGIRAELSKMKKDEIEGWYHQEGMTLMSRGDSSKEKAIASTMKRLEDEYNKHPGSRMWSHGDDLEAKTAKEMASLTEEHLKAHADKHAEDEAKRKQRHDEYKDSIDNPKTAQDWQRKRNMAGGYHKLTPEQQAAHDEAYAAYRREKQPFKPKRETEVKQLGGEGKNLDFTLTKNFHSKRGHDIFTATPGARVDRGSYDEMNAAAKKLGGWYYKKYGNTPDGFHFPTEQARDKFLALQKGSVDNSEDLAAKEEQSRLSQGQKLAEKAVSLMDRGEESLGRGRKDNTARRARMAASAEDDARKKIAMGKTMDSLAQHIESGKAVHLQHVKAMSHVEALDSHLRMSKWNRQRAEVKEHGGYQAPGYYDLQRRHEEERNGPPLLKDIAHAEYPYPYMHRSEMQTMGSKLKDVPGLKMFGGKLLKMAQGLGKETDQDYGQITDRTDLEKLKEAIPKMKRHHLPEVRQMASRFGEKFDSMKRLEAMDITGPAELRAALREYHGVKANPEGPDPIKTAERELKRKKIAGFFPTPRTLVERMLDHADIEDGHEVLEPSAGIGSIMDAIKERHPGANQHGIEQDYEIAKLLELKGHSHDRGDFLKHDKTYDRIVMNPPFEHRQDEAHVKHAYSLLKPGGKMVAITGSGAHTNQRSAGFQDWLSTVGAKVYDNPDGSFNTEEAFKQTPVNTKMVIISKPTGENAEKYAAWANMYEPKYLGSVEIDRYADDDGDYLSLATGFEVERYEWRADLHPRQEAGQSIGGQFAPSSGGSVGVSMRGAYQPRTLSSISHTMGQKSGAATPQKPQIAGNTQEKPPLPGGQMTGPKKAPNLGQAVTENHHLHINQLDRDIAGRHGNAFTFLNQALGSAFLNAQSPEEQKAAWKAVDKSQVTSALNQINQIDKDAKARGVDYASHVNATQAIPRALTQFLGGGSRFFDQDRIADKLKTPPPGFQPRMTADEWNKIHGKKQGGANPLNPPAIKGGFQTQEPQPKPFTMDLGKPESTPSAPDAPSSPDEQQKRRDYWNNYPVTTPATPEQEAKPEAQPQPQQRQDGPITRAFNAGVYRGTIGFENKLHQDLYDLGSMRSGRRNSGQNPKGKNAEKEEALFSSIADKTGMERHAIVGKAYDVWKGTREQMKGMQEGEHRATKMDWQKPEPEKPAEPPKHEIAAISKQMSNRLDSEIKSLLGSENPEMIADFRKMVDQAFDDERQHVAEHNKVVHYLAGGAGKVGAAISWARNTSKDASSRKAFDEVVQEAKTQWPHFFGGDGHDEDQAMELLQNGTKPEPKIYDEPVMNRALTMAGPAFFQGYDQGEFDPDEETSREQERKEWESVPFSWRGAKIQIEVMRYWNRAMIDRYAKQLSFDFEEKHPRETAKHDGKLPGQFAPKETHPRPYDRVISGMQSSPSAISSFRDSGRPIGISVEPRSVSANVVDRVRMHAESGYDVFLDSGIASTVIKGKGVDFAKVFTGYKRIIDDTKPSHRSRIMVVAPDHLEKLEDGSFRGDQAKTLELQREWRKEIEEIQDMGATVIVPVQRGEESLTAAAANATDAIDFSNGRTAFGIPANKGAWDLESILDLAKNQLGEPAHFHLLGAGKGKTDEIEAKIHAINPDIRVTGDAASEVRNRHREKAKKELKESGIGIKADSSTAWPTEKGKSTSVKKMKVEPEHRALKNVGDGYYYIASGAKNARHTLRYKSMDYPRAQGEPPVTRDNHVENLTANFDTSLAKVMRLLADRGESVIHASRFELNDPDNPRDPDVFKFGKYEGKRISDVDDPAYVQWAWSQDWFWNSDKYKRFREELRKAGQGPMPEIEEGHALSKQAKEAENAQYERDSKDKEIDGEDLWKSLKFDNTERTFPQIKGKRNANSFKKGFDWFDQPGKVYVEGDHPYPMRQAREQMRKAIEKFRSIAESRGGTDAENRDYFWYGVHEHASRALAAMDGDAETEVSKIQKKIRQVEAIVADKLKAMRKGDAKPNETEQYSLGDYMASIDRYFGGERQTGFDFAEGHEPVSATKAKLRKSDKQLKEMHEKGGLKIIGTSKDVTECERCGRMFLDKTIMVGEFGEDGKLGDVHYYGSDCVTKIIGGNAGDNEKAAVQAQYMKQFAKPSEKDSYSFVPFVSMLAS